ncbi:phosphatidylserine decarboxylase [Pelagibaculum spongiae]|uniref:Phosphatidylserine decarboxylase proenzyme n=2 Tax=Pelagibaculum spongiae TaxID=2080658 RepID=A0A2V1GVX8_9GAMM|nr:phosphatidylserine decarboxylase [Pelagibaculum spongiae]
MPNLKNKIIHWFIKRYQVDLSQAEREDPESYESFNDFFTRSLKQGMRPLPEDAKQLVCPADGAISQLGNIENGRIFQAKGHDYSLADLLGGSEERAAPFQGGKFATIYLSPKDYHRVHMPIAGRLTQMVHVPGRLFSVNPLTARQVPNLFARNERVVAIFETEIGPVALVLVGAMIVAGIETVWSGLVTPPAGKEVQQWEYPEQVIKPICLERGDEMGRFLLGSTVIMLLPEGSSEWAENLTSESVVRMGQSMGQILK